MRYGFSILMFCLSGLLLLYAAYAGTSGDPKSVPKRHAAEMNDPQAYAKKFAALLALTAIAPLIAGIVGLFQIFPAGVLALILTLPLFLALGVKRFFGKEDA